MVFTLWEAGHEVRQGCWYILRTAYFSVGLRTVYLHVLESMPQLVHWKEHGDWSEFVVELYQSEKRA